MEIFAFDAADAERYADVLARTVGAVANDDRAAAVAELRPIAGEIWMGKLSSARRAGNNRDVAGTRRRDESLRAQVFIRDGFRCAYCGGRAVPRSILVAISDLFPETVQYDIHYRRGKIHPVFWALAPEADHVFPHSRGGPNELENLTTLHAGCNTRKSDSLVADLPTIEIAPAAGPWDGLLSTYAALIAAGAGAARPEYHRQWSQRYARLMA